MNTHAKSNDITIYTDGSSRGNPGLGGWAAIVMTNTHVVELAGSQNHATNNQMELLAVQASLAFVQDVVEKKDTKATFGIDTLDEVLVHADSKYVLNGLESWVDGWVRNGWMTSAKKPVENKTYWEALLALRNFFGTQLQLIKVAGHSGHLYNDRCDELAVQAALLKSGEKQILFVGTREAYEGFLALNGTDETKTKTPTKKTKSANDGKKAFSYVSFVDGVAHADSTWAACESRVKGKKNAKFKKVFSKVEETSLIQEYTLSSLL